MWRPSGMPSCAWGPSRVRPHAPPPSGFRVAAAGGRTPVQKVVTWRPAHPRNVREEGLEICA